MMTDRGCRAKFFTATVALLIVMTTETISKTQSLNQPGFSYEEYDRLTQTYVNERGRVNYAGLKTELAALKGFIDQLSAASPENKPEMFASADERKRYYLTAYNAYVLYFAAKAYPDRHVFWARLGWFKNKEIVLGGRHLTLSHLEHKIIRKQFLDPRIHFYLNCGARSCPPLKARAIAENATESELEEAARSFINDTANVRFDPSTRTLYLSKIFDWYERDFISYLKAMSGGARPRISDYIALYLAGDPGRALARTPADKVRIKYLSYDKGLNDEEVRR